MSTREWVAVHRKHHAKCETADDPHSPQVKGIRKVLWQGAELYRDEAANAETLKKFSHGTPDDWLENRLYGRHTLLGVGLMLVIDVLLLGAIGLLVWAVQMVWIPFWAAGVVNGLGHYWGYRNFEVQDASTNISRWGILIGGEELHNHYHTYPTSARFSVRPYEFDLGWCHIRVLQALRLVRVKKVPPRLRLGAVRPVAVLDAGTLETLIANRYEMMARYARGLRSTCKTELQRLGEHRAGADRQLARLARRWWHRDADRIPGHVLPRVQQLRSLSPVIDTMVHMREELRQLWLNTTLGRDQLLERLRLWCQQAEDSGIAALQDFSRKLCAAC